MKFSELDADRGDRVRRTIREGQHGDYIRTDEFTILAISRRFEFVTSSSGYSFRLDDGDWEMVTKKPDYFSTS